MIKFKNWIEKRIMTEMMGSVGSIVSCGDVNNKNFQVQGALSNLGCTKKEKTMEMKFNRRKKK